MRTIHKQSLELAPVTTLELPAGAKPMTVQNQNDKLMLWYECDPTRELTPRQFYIAATGETMPDAYRLSYIATAQIGWTVWHVYEVLT